MSDLKLQKKWILWNHKLNDKSWSNDSYKNIFEYKNLYDLRIYFDNLDILQLQNSMYFIMRDGIFPTWEDKNNKNGCCASFKVLSNDILETWKLLLQNILCENIHKNIQKYDNINGLSISPKKEFNIIKIWFKCKIKNIDDYLNIDNKYINTKNVLIKNN
ncbi:eukaryotic translation initiation factor EIF4E family protein [bacterium]|nr:eukaryotic translation initiation factor EIF4E family protein [bacterium]|tara:strand:- start:23 stop:502 length:480 start_codon:yes stop_codon:yes gene_type:complete